MVDMFVCIYRLACFCPLLVKEDWAECVGELGDSSGINWKRLLLTYAFLLALLVIIVPAMILIFINIHVFIIARYQYLKCIKAQHGKAKVFRFQQCQNGSSFNWVLGGCGS